MGLDSEPLGLIGNLPQPEKKVMLSNSFSHIMSHPGLVQTTGLLIQTLGHGMVPIVFWGKHSCQGQFIALIQMGVTGAGESCNQYFENNGRIRVPNVATGIL